MTIVRLSPAVPVAPQNEEPAEYSVERWFARAAASRPGSPALSCGPDAATFAQLDAAASRLAAALAGAGARPGSAVAVLAARSQTYVAAVIGCLRAGAAFAVLDPALPELRLRRQLGLLRPAALVSEPELAGRAAALLAAAQGEAGGGVEGNGSGEAWPGEGAPVGLVCADGLGLRRWPREADAGPWGRPLDPPSEAEVAAWAAESAARPAPDPDGLAYVYFTSGSTGEPKGVAGRLKGIAHFINWEVTALGLGAGVRVSHLLPPSFDGSLRDFFVPLCAGGVMCAPPSRELIWDAESLLRWLEEERVELVHCVPTLLRALMGAGLDARRLPSLRWVLVSGEALVGEDVRRWLARGEGARLVNLYGATETTMTKLCHFVSQEDAARRTVPIGKPMPGAKALLVNEKGKPSAPGTVGEVYVRTPYRSLGYYGRPDLTARVFVPNPFGSDPADLVYRTGDLARQLPDGSFEFVGRRDGQVKVRGQRVELAEVEGVLRRQPGVEDVAVAERRGPGGYNYLCAWVVPGEGWEATAMLEGARRELAEWMVPSAAVRVERLPRTASGKVDRRALPDPRAATEGREYVEPRTPTEELVAGVWAEVLGLERVGAADNFFELGGHSLLATRLLSRVRSALGVELPLRQLFETPTVAGLAAAAETQLRAGAAPELPPISPAPRDEPPPLSYAQQRLWFINQLEPGSPAYNIPSAVRLSGDLNVSALESALGEVARRHETLRTSFPAEGGRPVQVISPPAPVTLDTVDLSQLPAAEREEEARRLAAEEAQRPFDLSRGPLWRASLVKLADDEHVLLLTMHHIVSDGWSVGLLTGELSSGYSAYARGEEPSLPELQIQYADYAAWQREHLSGEALDAQLAYWRERLSGAPPVLELPTDRPRPALQSHRGARLSFALNEEVSRGLHQLARAEGATAFMVLLAAFNALLHRYTNQTDILVGTPVAGRTRSETENLIGCFVNTLVLRTRVEGRETFRELLGKVREACLGAYAHQDAPFERVVEEAQPERSLSHSPLFQVVFVLQNTPSEEAKLTALELSPFRVGGTTAKFDLVLSMTETGGRLAGGFEYSTDLFDEATITRMAGHFEELLRGALHRPGQRVAELPLLPEAERRALLGADAAGVYAGAACLHELFEAQAARTPHAVALVDGEARLTYAELNARANRLARHLRGLGVGPDEPVCVLTERSAELVLALLGVLKAGGAYVPLDPEYPLERVRYTLEDSRARVLVTHGGLAQNLPAGGCQVVNLDDLGEAPDGLSGENLDGAMSPDNLAYVIYTSGSTGEPKGTPVTHRNVVRLFEATREWFGFDERDVWTLFHSYAFDFSVWEMWGALLHGGRLVVVPRWVSRSPELFYELLSEQRVTVLNQTPSAFRQLLRAEQTSDARRELSLRFVIFGGEALDLAGLGPWFDAHGDESPRLVNMYGITETTVHVTHRPLSREDALAPRGSLIGGPIPDLRLYVLDRHMQLVPQGVAGELCVGGAGLARGYLNRAGLTAERFIPDPFSKEPGARLYRSGDLARRLHGGDVEYLGRIDQQVKLRGFRIEPGEIEAALTAHPAVREAVVLPREDEPGERRLVAYVTTAEGRAVTGGELYAFVGRRLPDYMMPAAFVTLDALPLTPNGKVDRRALPPPGQSRPAPDESFAAPRNLVEELLAQMWADVLRVSQAGIHDNFFELGGHSLLATQIVSRVRQTFSVELPLRRLFESPTVAALAEAVERELRAGARAELPPISPVPRDEPLPLSYAQQRLWFIDQLEPGAATYNIPTAVRLTDGPDVTALERALSEVARRHETLRTTFLSDGGRPAQVVNPPAPVALERVDLSHLPAEEREAEARRLTAEEARRPFDLSRGPLWRASLLKLADDEHVLLLTMHHIVSDGWSMGLLVRELSALYSAYARGEEPTLAELPIQYADYAAWQRRHLTDEALGEQLAYWRGQLAGAPPVLELPTDRPRPAVQTYRGARVPFALGEELSGELMRLARAEGVTPFMALLAAFDALLYHYTGQSDILVGSPVAGRTRAETENLIGCFVNTLVLRTRVEGRETFRELLGKVREACLGAYAHQDAPFERVVEEAQPERSLSHSPLFQVVFVLQNTPAGETNPAGLGVSPFRVEGATSKFDLMLTLTETGGRLAGGFEYSTDLFDAATVERMAGHFRELLRGAVERPGQRVAELPLLTEDERRALLGGEAGRAPLPEACLHELFEEQVGLRPEAVALAFAGEQLTYAELNARADRLALRLRRHGVGPESLVGVMLERSADLVVALLGVLKAGGAYLPLDSEYPKERLAFMLEDAAPRVVLTRRSLAAALPESGAALLALDDEGEAAPAPAGGPPHSASPDNLAYVIYTSGSTGRPKGVAVTHRNVVRLVKGADYAELDPAQVFLQFAPVSFDASTFEVWGCLLNGGRLVVMPPDTPSLEELGRVVNESGVTTLWLTAGLFHQMVDERLEDLRGVTQLLAGGDALSARHVNKYLQTLTPGRRLVNGYGPTESTTFACCHRMEAGAEVGESVPIGRQISNTRAYVLDATLRPSPAGVIGELYLGGYGLARGYLNRPALTAGRFVPDPHSGEAGARLYRTGDLVRRRADGLLEFVGRRDGQVKVRGFRVEAGEVEAALLGHASVRECAVAARGEGGARRLVAYVVPEAGAGAADAAGLREHLRGRLPDYMLPSQFVTLESLPLTPNGKVDRGALPAPEPPQAGVAYVAPSTELERTLAGIWADVLGVERVGTDDGFFELGGHSLLLIQAQSKLREALGREVAMVDLFKYPTVRALAAYLEGDGPAGAAAGQPEGHAEARRELRERRAGARRRRQEGRDSRAGHDRQGAADKEGQHEQADRA